MSKYIPLARQRPEIADVEVAREKSMLLHDQSATLREDSKRLFTQSQKLRETHRKAAERRAAAGKRG